MILATCKKVVVDIKFGLNESEGKRFLLNIKPPKPSSKSLAGQVVVKEVTLKTGWNSAFAIPVRLTC